MYRAFYQLQDNPFSLTPDPDYLFLSASHQEALDHLDYGVRERKGFIEIVGAPGTGKTTLCRLFLDRAGHHTRTAYIFNTYLSDVELLRTICDEFGLKPEAAERKALTDAINRFLIDVAAEGGNAVLLIDEAQNLSHEALEQLRMLSNLETATEKLLQVVLVGQFELHARLKRPELAQLNERIAVRHRLEPLGRGECEAYIVHRLGVAGWQGVPDIAPEALDAVWRHSGGVPRRVNIICDRALLVAYAAESTRLTGAEVARAMAELQVLDLPAASRPVAAAPRVAVARVAEPRDIAPVPPRQVGAPEAGCVCPTSGRSVARSVARSIAHSIAHSWLGACVLGLAIVAGGWAWFQGASAREPEPGMSAASRHVVRVDDKQRVALDEGRAALDEGQVVLGEGMEGGGK